jgi:tRNA G37 N-methylase Trm5
LKLVWLWRNWTLAKRGDYYEMKNGKTTISLTERMASIFIAECNGTWKAHYMPPFSLTGKTVLDAGAGCGETAYFYLANGAGRVVAVEANKERASLIEENATTNGWNVEVVAKPFSIDMLDSIPHDFLKVDIEGGERALLTYGGKVGEFVMETHGEELTQTLARVLHPRRLIHDHADRFIISSF